MEFKLYQKMLDNEEINYVLDNIDNNKYHQGRVGNRVNPKQKIRKDLFIEKKDLLEYIDNTFYNKLYENINENFSDIKYREKWKIGYYDEIDSGFYNLHTDTAGDTKYRNISSVIMLSNANDYEGGELYFPDLNKTFKLDKGDIIVFDSTLLHGVRPITKGKRHVLISFFFDDNGMKIKEKFVKNLNLDNYKPQLSNFKFQYPKNNYKSGKEIDLYNKGDIDYSDLWNKDKWTNDDDYFFEDNNSDILLITFAGMGWKKSVPTFIFYNFLKKYDNIDKFFLRDIKMRYYLTGLKNNTDNLNDTIEFIKKIITKKKYKKIIGLGCSAGGYAAILFGTLLQFDKIIAFSPQVVLTSKKESLIDDIYNAPQTCKWLSEMNKNDSFYQKCLDLKNFIPFNNEINIHYSVNGTRGCDKKHALYLESNNCKIIEHPGNDHMIALTLRNNGKLKEIIDSCLQ